MAEYTEWKIEPQSNEGIKARIIVAGDRELMSGLKVSGEVVATANTKEYAQLIVALQNVAVKLNPENPLAVAEGMKDIIKMLASSLEAVKWILETSTAFISAKNIDVKSLIRDIEQALASIERGK